MVMYMEANEGKLRRDEGIPDEKVMAFDPRDLLPSDIALEMEGAEVTAREAVVAHAVDSGPAPASPTIKLLSIRFGLYTYPSFRAMF